MDEIIFPFSEWGPNYLKEADASHPWLTERVFSRLQVPPPPMEVGEEAFRIEALHHRLVDELRVCKACGELCDRVLEIQNQDTGFRQYFVQLAKNVGSTRVDKLNTLFDNIDDFAPKAYFFFKRYFARARPYHYLPKLVPATNAPVIGRPPHPAYPSGHATMSFLYAHLCAECIPKGKDAFFRLATRISLNRELAGVHFPSDTQAGIVLGRQLFEIMLVNPAARKLIDDARG
jgi:hypothetical protein